MPLRRGWAVCILLLVTNCGSRTSLSVGTHASVAVGGTSSEGGFYDQGVGGRGAGAGGKGGSVGGAPGVGGGMFAGGMVGAGGGAVTCFNGTACGGDLVGPWSVASSCLVLSGDLDVSLVSLGCRTVPVTGLLQVTGTWVAKANGEYQDDTITTGSMEFPLDAACQSVSSVPVECSKFSSVFTIAGWTTSTCAIIADGTCHCLTTVKQRGGLGVVSPWASTSGSYRASGGGLAVDDEVDYSYCISGTMLNVTPKPTILPMTGTVRLERPWSPGAGGATATGGTKGP